MKEFNKCPKKWLPTPLSPKNPYAPHGVEPCRRDYETRLDRLGDVSPDGERNKNRRGYINRLISPVDIHCLFKDKNIEKFLHKTVKIVFKKS